MPTRDPHKPMARKRCDAGECMRFDLEGKVKHIRANVVATLTATKEAIELRASYSGPDPDPRGSAKLLGKSEALRQVLAWMDETV